MSQVVGCAICAIVVLIGFIRSVLVFKTQWSTVELRTGHAALAVPHPLHKYRNRFHHQLQQKLLMGDPFTILQFSANGIGNNQVELGEFLERHKVKLAVIQESKLTLNSCTPNIQNFTTVRKDRHQDQVGGLLALIHKSINFSRRPDSPDPHLEELTITAKLRNIYLIITKAYIPPASSFTGGYNPSLDHLMMTTDPLILGDFNAHHSLWYSSSTDSRGTMLESMVSGSNFGILNCDSPTRLPGNANPSSPDVSLASASLITSTNWQTKTCYCITMGEKLSIDHYTIILMLI